MARRRSLPRYKKTAIVIAGVGVATGIAAVLLWPQLQKLFHNPAIKVLTPTITPIPDGEIDYNWVDTIPR